MMKFPMPQDCVRPAAISVAIACYKNWMALSMEVLLSGGPAGAGGLNTPAECITSAAYHHHAAAAFSLGSLFRSGEDNKSGCASHIDGLLSREMQASFL